MMPKYNVNDKFNKKVIDTCFTPEAKSQDNFKLVEKCLGNRDIGVQNFGIDQSNKIFKYCIARETYMSDEQGENVLVKVPENVVKCINCVVDNSGGCETFINNTRGKDANCNCTENRTAESKKKKKIEKERQVSHEDIIKAIVTTYPSISSNNQIQQRSFKPKINTVFKKTRQK